MCPQSFCRLNYDALIDYNVPGGSAKLMFPTMPMSESGRKHFEEVKDIFLAMQWVAVLGLAVFGIYLLRDAVRTGKMREAAAFHAAHTLRLRYRWMLWSVWLAAGIGGIVLLAVIIDWENAFTLMHKIFFDNDDWLFNPQTDPIITILPDTFFMHCGLFDHRADDLILHRAAAFISQKDEEYTWKISPLKALFFSALRPEDRGGQYPRSPQIGMSKNDFTKLCTEPDFIPDLATIERVLPCHAADRGGGNAAARAAAAE